MDEPEHFSRVLLDAPCSSTFLVTRSARDCALIPSDLPDFRSLTCLCAPPNMARLERFRNGLEREHHFCVSQCVALGQGDILGIPVTRWNARRSVLRRVYVLSECILKLSRQVD